VKWIIMSIRRKVTTAAIALGLLAGGGIAAAPAAQAGTSIPATYNGASHIYYKFAASNNKFCVKPGARGYADVRFYRGGKRIWGTASSRRIWTCVALTKHGFKEGEHATFKLRMYSASTVKKRIYKLSSGRVYI
jgi:hypothetical protein